MVISGGDHLQWPPYGELGTRRPTIEKEIDMEQAFDEAMWEWVLEQGPPQDDDVVWLKDAAAYVGMDACLEYMGMDADYSQKVGKAWGDRVREKLSCL